MIIWNKEGVREKVFNDYIDLGLPSGTLWSYRDFYRTGERIKFDIYYDSNFYLTSLIPSKGQFLELSEFCSVKKYNNFYLFTSKINGNKLILFDGYYKVINSNAINIDKIICPATTKFYCRSYWCLRLVKKNECN
jgi:hypothetical protein